MPSGRCPRGCWSARSGSASSPDCGRGRRRPLPGTFCLTTPGCPGSSGKPHAWREIPRSRRRPLPPSPRARCRRGRPRCDEGRVHSCRDDRPATYHPPWAVRLNLVSMRTHLWLLINPRSGDDSPSAEEVAAEAERLGIEVHLLKKDEDPAELARASSATTLGMAGGDGSLAAVAEVAIETGAAFVCIPFGTRNHFARDVGLDRNDPIAALRAFVDGVERRIDVGRAGDRLFLNNVSFGVYARLVHRREHRRRRGEALARLKALLTVARHRHALHAKVNDEPIRARAIFVGNNCYELSLFTVGERERLDEGELFLWTAAGWLPTSWEQKTARMFSIDTGGERVRAAVDGEPVVFETPLELESLPGALRLLLPAGEEREDDAMHDNPEPTEREQELAQTDRQNEEESQRYPSEGQPDSPDDASDQG